MDKEKKLTTKGKTGAGEASFRVYYGATGAAVPFKWESQPGTPKHALSDYSAVPPLTPPPSYLARSCRVPDSPWNPNTDHSHNHGHYRKLKRVLLFTRLRRLVRRSSHVSPNSYSSPSLSSSMSSEVSYFSPTKGRKTRGPQPLVFALMDDEFAEERGSSSMRMCFGDSMSNMKDALFSVVGCHRHRSNRSVDYFVQ